MDTPTPNTLTCTGLSRYALRVSWSCAARLAGIKQKNVLLALHGLPIGSYLAD